MFLILFLIKQFQTLIVIFNKIQLIATAIIMTYRFFNILRQYILHLIFLLLFNIVHLII